MQTHPSTLSGPLPCYHRAAGPGSSTPAHRDARWLDLNRQRAFEGGAWYARRILARAVWADCGWRIDLCRDQEGDEAPTFRVFAGPSLIYRGGDPCAAQAEWARLVASRPHWMLKAPGQR